MPSKFTACDRDGSRIFAVTDETTHILKLDANGVVQKVYVFKDTNIVNLDINTRNLLVEGSILYAAAQIAGGNVILLRIDSVL